MCQIISISNQKGGVGKTTTTISLAGALLSYEKRVLVVDMDPQGNCAKSLGIDSTLFNHTLYDVLAFNYEIKKCIKKTRYKNLDLLPSKVNLALIETKLNDKDALFALKKHLDNLNNYDYILIDTPPSFGFLSLSALIAANSVVIPVQCEYFAMEAVSQVLSTISNVQFNYNENLKILGFLLTMYDSRLRLATDITIEIRRLFKEKTFVTQIPRNQSIVEAQMNGMPITVFKPNSIGANAYISLVKEIMDLENNQ